MTTEKKLQYDKNAPLSPSANGPCYNNLSLTLSDCNIVKASHYKIDSVLSQAIKLLWHQSHLGTHLTHNTKSHVLLMPLHSLQTPSDIKGQIRRCIRNPPV